ncbi:MULTISPECIES: hypothetical protein [Cupriavidus]|uniref:DUF4942 domain-containing protein n=1 Tax=Cupriavidus basilensis TaxID=68895 RepID=A0A643FR42_9BURK|nr:MULTISPECIES: hypothetical protein [Cupriavidus]KUE86393.1 hypothetical protein ASL20_23300 [Cupriavidus necator]NOV23593.1 hypothetical protein [Cupriavidus necator]QOT81667.1 hypothetical protein F7R26_037260 [Cupriavidus basilensis]BDB30122.1 hypothetical protein CTP10_R75390 [Cupriavidus sp. P-10]
MYNEIIERFVRAQEAACAAYRSAASFERECLAGIPGNSHTVEIRSEYGTARELESFCSSLAGNVVNRARREFAPAGTRLDIDDTKEHEHAGLDIGKALKAGKIPDIDGLWASLHDRYGGSGGKELAYQQAAQRIIKGFWLNRRNEVQRTASAVILRMRVTSEGCYGRSCRKVGYYSCQTAADCLQGLTAFAAKAGHSSLASGLSRINVHNIEYNYREKQSHPGLDIVFFKDGWEFKFSHQVAEALMLFIGEFGAAFMEETA